MKQHFLSLFALCLLSLNGFSQMAKPNKYGLKIIGDVQSYKEQVKLDSNKTLVEIKKYIPNIALDIRYATTNNFMGEQMYASSGAFTRLPVVRALQKVQKELNQQGLGLKIFDGYRPYTVTVAFYEKQKDSVFVAAPWKGSRHNRGCAIDLTIIDLKTGKELKMPTGFDDFTKKAYADYSGASKKATENRELLKAVMSKNGFTVYKEEWWHYDFNNWKDYDLTDISFEELHSLQVSQ